MNISGILTGIGYIGQALADAFVKQPHDYMAAYTDFLKGLGMLGVHNQIVKIMAAEGLSPADGSGTPPVAATPPNQP